MNELGPFWDEECLGGEIVCGPSASGTQSLFDTNLFCDEETLDSIVPEPEDPLPFDLAAPEPVPALASIPLTQVSQAPWRTFLDANCPLRKRVKVTITPSRKRPAPIETDTLQPSKSVQRVVGADSNAAPRSGPTPKRRKSGPQRQSVLHFPPVFGPDAPRQLVCSLPDTILSNDETTAPSIVDTKPKSYAAPRCARDTNGRRARPRSLAAELNRAQSAVEDCSSTVQGCVVEDDVASDVSDGPLASLAHLFSNCSETSSVAAGGHVSEALRNRLGAVRRARSPSLSANTSSCSLPAVDDAVAAVREAATAYSGTLAALAVAAASKPARRGIPSAPRRARRARRALTKFEEKPVSADEREERIPCALTKYVQSPGIIRHRVCPPMP